jgi:hypothetical protein
MYIFGFWKIKIMVFNSFAHGELNSLLRKHYCAERDSCLCSPEVTGSHRSGDLLQLGIIRLGIIE